MTTLWLSVALNVVNRTTSLTVTTKKFAYGNLAPVRDLVNRQILQISWLDKSIWINNKANLRDLIAATSLVILLKLDSNCRLFSPCDHEIWWMTLKNYRAPLLHYIKLCASSQTPRWIKTGVTVRKRSIRVKIGNFLSHVSLKFDGWPWKTIGHLFYVTSSFVYHHFIAIGELKL